MNEEPKNDEAIEAPVGETPEKRGLFGRKRKKMTMKEQIREIMPLVYVLIIGAIGYGIYYAVTYNWAAEFELTDQRHNVHTVDFPSEKPLVIAFTDRDSGSQLQKWVIKLMGSYGDKIESHRIFDFTKLDGRARFLAPGFMARIPVAILIDEDGSVSQKYGYNGGDAALFVVSPEGTIKARVKGEMTDGKWTTVASALDELLNSTS